MALKKMTSHETANFAYDLIEKCQDAYVKGRDEAEEDSIEKITYGFVVDVTEKLRQKLILLCVATSP